MRPSFVIYGNCQGGILAEATKFIPGVQDQYEVVYFRSFSHPTEGRMEIDKDIMARCAIFWKQLDESSAFPDEIPVNASTKVVTFPPVDLGLLWPFQTHDKIFAPEPAYEYGMFPYGDRLAIEISESSTSSDPASQLVELHALAEQRAHGLARYREVESLRLSRREIGSDIKLASFVLSNFMSERLFWAYNHPTKHLFSVILRMLGRATWPETWNQDENEDDAARIFSDWDPLSDFQVPVHRAVARNLGIKWWSDSDTYRFHGGVRLSLDEYFRLYLNERSCRLRVG